MVRLPLLILSASLLACTVTPAPTYPGESARRIARARPEWVEGAARRYPASRYLTGVGRGSDRVDCEGAARGALARVFAAQVRQVSTDWQEHFSRANAGGSVQVEAMSLGQLTRVSTDYALKGAQITEIWQDGAAVHCLATLERLPAARNLRRETERLDVEIAAKVAEGDRAPNATARLFGYKRAMELLQQRQALDAELRIVDPDGGKQPRWGWGDLVGKLTGAQSKINIGLRVGGRDAARVQACLTEQLAQRGIRVLGGTGDVDLMVHGTLKWDWAGQLMGSYMVELDLRLHIREAGGGQAIGTLVETLKTRRPQREMALQAASNKLCLKVAPRLAQQIERTLGR